MSTYKNATARQTAIVSRALCRLVLSQYCDTAAQHLQFTRGQHGKPELLNNPCQVRFNLSHNDKRVVMAVCLQDDIGCDIENPLRKVALEPITRRFFSQQEHQQLSALTGTEQHQRFFEYWTLKEAFVKATGYGISLGLNSFYFNFTAQQEEILLHFNDNYSLDKKAPWQFYQTSHHQQLIAICRNSQEKQHINYCDPGPLLSDEL